MKDINAYPLWTAIITPMLQDGSVDYESYKNLLKEQEEANNGILVLGSTGEALNIGLEEQRQVLDFVMAQNLKVPLMCGVGGINLPETKAWVEYLNTLNLDAYLMVSPLYAKPGDEGQYLWFKELMDVANKPVMLYNVPSRTGKPLSHAAVKRLADHPKLWAIKEASGSTEEFSQYVSDAPNARVYSGDDALLPDFSPLGAKGLVSVASNVWPKATHLYTKKALANQLNEVGLWQECTNALFCVSNPIPAKVLIHKLGRISHATLRLPLTENELKEESIIMNAHKNIETWYQENKEG